MGLTDKVNFPQPAKFILNWGRKYSLWVMNFGLACCAIELIAASTSRHDFIRLGVIPVAHGPRQADMLVVAGTLTDKMAPALKRVYEQIPEPKYVISFGSCSNCGGPFWDSYSVTKGVDQIVPVDVYVPGCPPRPEALLEGILLLQERIGKESLKEHYGRREAAASREREDSGCARCRSPADVERRLERDELVRARDLGAVRYRFHRASEPREAVASGRVRRIPAPQRLLVDDS